MFYKLSFLSWLFRDKTNFSFLVLSFHLKEICPTFTSKLQRKKPKQPWKNQPQFHQRHRPVTGRRLVVYFYFFISNLVWNQSVTGQQTGVSGSQRLKSHCVRRSGTAGGFNQDLTLNKDNNWGLTCWYFCCVFFPPYMKWRHRWDPTAVSAAAPGKKWQQDSTSTRARVALGVSEWAPAH